MTVSADERLTGWFTPPALPSTMANAGSEAVWVPCGTCWGQGRILELDGSGRLRPSACPCCMGLTTVLR